jgi:hypothetical protein
MRKTYGRNYWLQNGVLEQENCDGIPQFCSLAPHIAEDFPRYKLIPEYLKLGWDGKRQRLVPSNWDGVKLGFAKDAILVPHRADFLQIKNTGWRGRGEGPTLAIAEVDYMVISSIRDLTKRDFELLHRRSAEGVRRAVADEYGIKPALDDMISIYSYQVRGHARGLYNTKIKFTKEEKEKIKFIFSGG